MFSLTLGNTQVANQDGNITTFQGSLMVSNWLLTSKVGVRIPSLEPQVNAI